jgi:CHC2-type zinc finger protein/ATPase family protein associated with various cellular activities (AAA)
VPKSQDYHEKLRPFIHHGVDLPNDPKQATGQCPFCSKPSHFSVKTETGQYRCLVCEESGNIATFLQVLYAKSLDSTPDEAVESLADERSLDSRSLRYFGIAQSITIQDEWLAPMYNDKGALSNLVRIVPSEVDGKTKYTLISTPGCKLWPFGVDQFLKAPKPNVYVAEGFWDLVALHGAFSQNRMASDKLIKTSDPNKAVTDTTGIIAAPGAGNWQAEWFTFLAGRNAYLAYDNDHPLLDQETGKPKIRNGNFIRPGWDGMQRVVGLAGQQTKLRPKSIHVLHWNHPEPGHNPDLAKGYDLRDAIADGLLDALLTRYVAAPLATISSPKNGTPAPAQPTVTPIKRESFAELVKDYENTLHFTQSLRNTLLVMLTTVTSTKFPPEGQLFFRVIGDPGSGKTTIAEAVSAAREWVSPKSILTGFHSGFVDYTAEGEAQHNSSLLYRLNGKTVVMKDADTLLSSPHSGRIMSELRDIFDGTSRAEYRTKQQDDFEDLRMTFILCGTKPIRQMDSAHLGARFLDFEIVTAESDQKQILDRVSKNTYQTMVQFMQNMNKPDTPQDSDENIAPTKAMFLKQVTYGFIKHFEENFHKLSPPSITPERQTRIEAMADFVSFMRARIQREGRSDDMTHRHARELPTRLTQQLTRFPFCAALILGKTEIDDEVLEVTRQVMIYTSVGFPFEIAEQLHPLGAFSGLSVNSLAKALGLSDSTVRRSVDDMIELGILGAVKVRNNSGQRGRDAHLLQLTPRMREVWDLAMGTPAQPQGPLNGSRKPTPRKESNRASVKPKGR